jgi:hypothetical protein
LHVPNWQAFGGLLHCVLLVHPPDELLDELVVLLDEDVVVVPLDEEVVVVPLDEDVFVVPLDEDVFVVPLDEDVELVDEPGMHVPMSVQVPPLHMVPGG